MITRLLRRVAAVALATVLFALPAYGQAKGNCVDLDSSNCFSSASCKGKRCAEDHPQCDRAGRIGTCAVVIQKPFNCCCVCQTEGPMSAFAGVGASLLGVVLLGVGLLVQRRSS